MTIGKVQEIEKKLAAFSESRKEVASDIKGLMLDKLIEDLQEAVKYKRGYYKNQKGEYLYVKGIEVTNDMSKTGYNGESRGVLIHYSEVSDTCCEAYSVPLVMFHSKFDPEFTDEKELMKPTTKEDFENKVKSTVEDICSDYQEKRPLDDYIQVVTEYVELLESLYETID